MLLFLNYVYTCSYSLLIMSLVHVKLLFGLDIKLAHY